MSKQRQILLKDKENELVLYEYVEAEFEETYASIEIWEINHNYGEHEIIMVIRVMWDGRIHIDFKSEIFTDLLRFSTNYIALMHSIKHLCKTYIELLNLVTNKK